ncbi:hypothetical protein SAMN04488587_1653 [Methanococcoides vulcani]|uniref:Uncharacterized protein n=1 Tax=Methanococcoides vulcani TaxID=1353158 RepID=A0A1I0AI20_9EURY|nr:hypothetical protein [Methanococcoides vulcani]SES93346.1 hypothetical protein SAMN04488587_1653 [Methanococcoides vulcani]
MHVRTQVCLIILFATLLCANTAIASSDDDTDWNESVNYTLYWGDTIEVDGFLIKANDFSKARPFDIETDYVMLTINSDESEEWSALLSVNNSQIPDSKIFGERLNITAFEIVTGNDIPAPYTKIEVSTLNITEEKVDSWINNTISVTKTKYKDTYIDERVFIAIQINNLRNLEFQGVLINETLPENILMDPDINVDQTINISPYSKNTIQYSVKALRPGNYTIPPTEIEIVDHGIKYYQYTNSTELVVYGPYINATKTATVDGNNPQLFDITVKVKNEGNRAAYVEIKDEMLQNSVLMEGKTAYEMVIFPDKVKTLEYSLRIEDTKINPIVPSAEIYFSDSKGYSDTFKTKRFYLFEEEEEIPEPIEIPEDDLETEVSENATESDGEDIEYPSFGRIRSVKDIIDNTMRIINEALEYK